MLRSELGVAVTRSGVHYTVPGVPEALCEEFSPRQDEIYQVLGGQPASYAAGNRAQIQTRKAKRGKTPPLADQEQLWRAVAARPEFNYRQNDTPEILNQARPLDNESEYSRALYDALERLRRNGARNL